MKYFIIILIFNALNAQFILTTGKRPLSRLKYLPKTSFKDMKTIPQDISFYAKQVKKMNPILQKKYDKLYNKRFFSPWDITHINKNSLSVGWEIKMVKKRNLYNANKEIISNKIKRYWIENANFKELDTLKLKAITIKHSNLRAMPTYSSFYLAKSIFSKYFNYNQNSAIYPNTPLYISHYSKDKKWAYVITPYTYGWININSIALVDKNFIKKFKNNNYAIAIKDNLRIYKNRKIYTVVKLGTIFPISNNKLLLATKDNNNYAKAVALIAIKKDIIAKKPLEFNSINVAKVAKEFIGEPYGWGGSFFCRDCSATTRDFFSIFGIFLSRNSLAQSKEGNAIKIPKTNPQKRKEFILKHAKPFRSLMFVPGHIALYIGKYNKEPIIMHTYWGVRKKDWSKIITSRTLISTLELGKERNDTREKSRLIYTLQKLINF